LDPILILGEVSFGVAYVVFTEEVAEFVHDIVIRDEFMGDGGTLAKERAGEAANACLCRIKDVIAEQVFLELCELWLGDDDIRSDAAATGDLAAAVGKFDLRRMIGNLALVVVFVERDGFVIALNQAATGGVVAGRGKRKARIFTERLYSLNEALAERRFADDEAPVVVLHSSRDDFGGRGGVIVHQNEERNGIALVAAYGVIVMLRGGAAVMRNYQLILLEEHIADGDGFVQEAAGIAAHVEHEAVEIGGVEFLESVGDFMIRSFVERREA